MIKQQALISIYVALGLVFASQASENITKPNIQKATFAAGCFWCIVSPFDKVDGVIDTVVGYAGGKKETAYYKKVSSGETNHIESVQVTYDANKVSYDKILQTLWINIDPLDGGGQFCDRGKQYASAIFYHNKNQQKIASASKTDMHNQLKLKPAQKIQTSLIPFTTFFPAEDKHQNYYKRNPWRYKFYRSSCGRDKRLKKIWGSPSKQ